MESSDFEIITIQGCEESPPRQPEKAKAASLPTHSGTLYIEARAKSDYKGSLTKLTAKLETIFHSGCVHVAKLNNEMIGADLYAECFFPDFLQSLKAVDYMGAEDDSAFILVEGNVVEINSYVMLDDKTAEVEEPLLLCDAQRLPSSMFQDTWERLIFDEEIKQNLVAFMANLLRFSYAPGRNTSSTVNRLILLSGPPGTGKTSLSTSLAQKLAIRLNTTFGVTILLRLNAATLLSQYFGQSAVKIHSIFESLASQSAAQPKTLILLLIDEIESLAGSRETSSARNEVHDAVRATNALLTGFDMVKNNPNVLIICTSNLSTSLDEAFMDRCSRHITVSPPSAAARYEILRHSINGLVERQIVQGGNIPLPTFDGAECRLPIDYKTAGCALRRLAEQLEIDSPNASPASPVSARWLSQLAEISLANELQPRALCTVHGAIQFMARYVDKTFRNIASKPGLSSSNLQNSKRKRKVREETAAGPSNKRKLDAVAKEETLDAVANLVEKRLEAQWEEMELFVAHSFDPWYAKIGMCDCVKGLQGKLEGYIEHGIPIDSSLYK